MYRAMPPLDPREDHRIQFLAFGPACPHTDPSTGEPCKRSTAIKIGRKLHYADTANNRRKMDDIRDHLKKKQVDDSGDDRRKRRKFTPRRAAFKTGLVERVNNMDPEDFWKDYMPDLDPDLVSYGCYDDEHYDTVVRASEELSDEDLDACFRLIEATSSEAYRESAVGWSRAKKKAEMLLPDMRYIMLKRRLTDIEEERERVPNLFDYSQGEVEGFVSFMITYEDGHEVIYCYEIHLASHLLGQGFGKHLMSSMEQVGCRVGVEKAMLTVFRSNSKALRFYEKLGYVEDEYSPQARLLRNGTVKEPSYVILSKPIERDVKLEDVPERREETGADAELVEEEEPATAGITSNSDTATRAEPS